MERDYSIRNSLMFALVMQHEDICKGFIERLFEGRKVKKLEVKSKIDLSTEKTIIADIAAKTIRLDVLFTDEDAWYDIEMQVENERFLPKRMRYYASSMDIKQLDRGKDDYDSLKKNYVIFICMFDYFKMDKPIYQFENYDIKNGIRLGDDAYKIMLNINCSEEKVPDYLKGLYAYIKDKVVPSNDKLLSNIDGLVAEYSKDREVDSIMTLYDEMKYRERRSYEDGKSEGKLDTAKKMKEDSLPVDLIMKYTGLSIEEIEKL